MISEEMDGVRVDCFMYSDSRLCDICVKSLKLTVPRVRANRGKDWESYDDGGAQAFYRQVTQEQYKLIEGVKDLMKLLKGKCVACFTKDNRKMGLDLNECPGLKNVCTRCLGSDHRVGTCNIEIKYICGCHTCGFPQNLYGEYMHGDAGTGECDMKDARHVIFSGTICLFKLGRLRRSILQEKFGFSDLETREELIKWITESENGEICNGLKAMVTWMNLQYISKYV
jgi:hypothetical protein